MKTYNGHRSWNAWNVSLWINNDEQLYNWAAETMKQYKNRAGCAAARMLQDGLRGQKTPDGATYNRLAVKLAIEDINN